MQESKAGLVLLFDSIVSIIVMQTLFSLSLSVKLWNLVIRPNIFGEAKLLLTEFLKPILCEFILKYGGSLYSQGISQIHCVGHCLEHRIILPQPPEYCDSLNKLGVWLLHVKHSWMENRGLKGVLCSSTYQDTVIFHSSLTAKFQASCSGI